MENIMNLVKVERNANYGLVVSSRVIAKALNKRHDNILRDIDAIIENQSAEISVNPISSNVRKLIFHNNYKDSRNRNYREYLLTKDGFIFENISREDKARVITYLVTNNVELDSIRELTTSLEDRFLQITGGENK